MKVTVEQDPIIHLKLTPREARRLMSAMQNPILHPHAIEFGEAPTNAMFREQLFSALRDALSE